jgi:DNA (cytosine-5)-methyltransferase 1
VSRRARLLDLFCRAGGASVGYHRAGFDVTGVDIEAHPDYPFPLIVENAIHTLGNPRYLAKFDAIHASPPCQAYTTMSNRYRGTGGKADTWPDLLEPVRDALLSWGGIYVIENVPGARRLMRNPVLLHGGMFGLGVHRPRLFESNAPLMLYRSPASSQPVGVYGERPDGRRLFDRADGTTQRAARGLEEAGAAMGIDWMTTWADLKEAIPPAYCTFIGAQLLAALVRQP